MALETGGLLVGDQIKIALEIEACSDSASTIDVFGAGGVGLVAVMAIALTPPWRGSLLCV